MEYIVLEKEEGMPWSTYMKSINSLAIGAVQEEELIGFAVYTERENNPDYIELNYIYVLEEWREQYVALSLLEYMETLLHGKYRYVLARIMEEDDEGADIYHLLMEAGFMPLQEKNKVLRYRIGDLYQSTTIQAVLKKCLQSKRIERVRRIGEERYQRFLDSMNKKGTDLSGITFDPAFSNFYRGKNGDYVGCILMEQNEKEMILKYLYIDEAAAGKYAILFLLCDALKRLVTLEKEKELVVSLCNQNYEQLFRYFFPMYRESSELRDYIRIL